MEKDRVQPHTTSVMNLLRGWVTTQPPVKWRQQETKVEKDRTNSKETGEEEERLEKEHVQIRWVFEDLVKHSQVDPA